MCDNKPASRSAWVCVSVPVAMFPTHRRDADRKGPSEQRPSMRTAMGTDSTTTCSRQCTPPLTQTSARLRITQHQTNKPRYARWLRRTGKTTPTWHLSSPPHHGAGRGALEQERRLAPAAYHQANNTNGQGNHGATVTHGESGKPTHVDTGE